MNETKNEGGAVAVMQERHLMPAQPFDLTPRTLEEAFKLADVLANSELVPKDFQKKPANVLVAVQWGHEIGLKPMQALQNIAVINGRPSLWGDAMLALVRADARCEWVHEDFDAAGTAVCQAKRRGDPNIEVRTFSLADATTAGLQGKSGPWQTSPKRMRQLRARAFCLRDKFPDVLKGIPMAEEVADYPAESGVIATPLDHLAQTEGSVPKELLDAGKEAAAKGIAAYAIWWKSLEPLQRKVAQGEHEALKIAAAEADKAREAAKKIGGVAADATPLTDREVAAVDSTISDTLGQS